MQADTAESRRRLWEELNKNNLTEQVQALKNKEAAHEIDLPPIPQQHRKTKSKKLKHKRKIAKVSKRRNR